MNQRHYSIVFNTTTGARRSIRINNPNPDLPREDIADAVEMIIDNDVFDQTINGGLSHLNRMELTVVERTAVL